VYDYNLLLLIFYSINVILHILLININFDLHLILLLLVGLLYGGDCCVDGGAVASVAVTDVAGNEANCRAGAATTAPIEGPSISGVPVHTVAIVGGVCFVLIVLVALAAIVTVMVVKRKQSAALAEMRQTPQAK